MKIRTQASLLGAALVLATGCTITTTDGTTTSGTGKLVAHWTISGVVDATRCTSGGAVNARVDVLDAAGTRVNPDDQWSCANFVAALGESFAGGTYTVQTTLLDGAGNPVTTTASSVVVVPTDGTEVDVTADFPPQSFLTAPTGTGKLVVSWTLDESTDANECSVRNVASARIDVLDASGTKVNTGADTQTCSALATSFTQSFNAGSYTVQATLLGADGSARTTTASTTTTIPGDGSAATVTFDFPSTSFF